MSWAYVPFWNFMLIGPRTRFANVNLPGPGASTLHTESDIGITHLPRTSLWSKVIFPLMKLKVEWQVGFDDHPGFILECRQPYPHYYIQWVIFKTLLKMASKKTYWNCRKLRGGGTLWLLQADVWQKPAQYYIAIILQLIINQFKKGDGGTRKQNYKSRSKWVLCPV